MLAKPGGARDYRGTIPGLDNVENRLSLGERDRGESRARRGASRRHRRGSRAREHSRRRQAGALDRQPRFGAANVVVAVPQAWIDVRTMADLDDVTTGFRAQHNRRMRVATKYINLTRSFFALHGIVDYRIVESAGATEGAPATGAAEMIVDITTNRRDARRQCRKCSTTA